MMERSACAIPCRSCLLHCLPLWCRASGQHAEARELQRREWQGLARGVFEIARTATLMAIAAPLAYQMYYLVCHAQRMPYSGRWQSLLPKAVDWAGEVCRKTCSTVGTQVTRWCCVVRLTPWWLSYTALDRPCIQHYVGITRIPVCDTTYHGRQDTTGGGLWPTIDPH